MLAGSRVGTGDQEVQSAEFTDISWHESVYRVRSKPQCGFTVKDYEQRDIPIPLDLLDELIKGWHQDPTGIILRPTGGGALTSPTAIIINHGGVERPGHFDGMNANGCLRPQAGRSAWGASQNRRSDYVLREVR